MKEKIKKFFIFFGVLYSVLQLFILLAAIFYERYAS